jgi:hypothetical protein
VLGVIATGDGSKHAVAMAPSFPCARCSGLLVPGTVQCPHCGFVLAPVASEPPDASRWPYPPGMPRTLPSFNLTFGLWFTIFPLVIFGIIGGVFWKVGMFELMGGNIALMAPALLVVLFPLIGVFALRSALRERANARALWTSGLQCWGQVIRATPTGAARRHGARRWLALGLEIAAQPVGDAAPAGPIRVTCTWYVSDMQASLVQPGGWVALLVDRGDPSVVLLEALRTPGGAVTPLQ